MKKENKALVNMVVGLFCFILIGHKLTMLLIAIPITDYAIKKVEYSFLEKGLQDFADFIPALLSIGNWIDIIILSYLGATRFKKVREMILQ